MNNSTGLHLVGKGTYGVLALVIDEMLGNLKEGTNAHRRLEWPRQGSLQTTQVVLVARIGHQRGQILEVLCRACEGLLAWKDPRQKSTMRTLLDDFLGLFGGHNGLLLQLANPIGILLELFQLKPIDLSCRDHALKLIGDLLIQRIEANALGTLDLFLERKSLQDFQFGRVKLQDPSCHLIPYEESCVSRASHQPTMVLTALSSVSSGDSALSKRISMSERSGCGTSYEAYDP